MKRFFIWNLITCVIFVLSYKTMAFFWAVFLTTGIWLFVVSLGVCYIRAGIFMECKPRFRQKNKVVLTIDDGPDPRLTQKILILLKKYDFPATFFLVGKEVQKYPDLVEKIVENSHTIGSHSFNHSVYSNFYLRKKWESEFFQTERALGEYLEKKWFRPPFALMSPHLAATMQKCGYILIGIHIRPLDFGNRQIKNLSKRLLKNIDKGGIVLLHGTLPENMVYLEEQILEELDSFFREIKESSQLEVLPLEKYLALYG